MLPFVIPHERQSVAQQKVPIDSAAVLRWTPITSMVLSPLSQTHALGLTEWGKMLSYSATLTALAGKGKALISPAQPDLELRSD